MDRLKSVCRVEGEAISYKRMRSTQSSALWVLGVILRRGQFSNLVEIVRMEPGFRGLLRVQWGMKSSLHSRKMALARRQFERCLFSKEKGFCCCLAC